MVSPVQDFEIENVTVVVNAPALKVEPFGTARSKIWSTRVQTNCEASVPDPIGAAAVVRLVAAAKPAPGPLFADARCVRRAVVGKPGPTPDQALATLWEIVSVPTGRLQKTDIQIAPVPGTAPGIPAVVDVAVAA